MTNNSIITFINSQFELMKCNKPINSGMCSCVCGSDRTTRAQLAIKFIRMQITKMMISFGRVWSAAARMYFFHFYFILFYFNMLKRHKWIVMCWKWTHFRLHLSVHFDIFDTFSIDRNRYYSVFFISFEKPIALAAEHFVCCCCGCHHLNCVKWHTRSSNSVVKRFRSGTQTHINNSIAAAAAVDVAVITATVVSIIRVRCAMLLLFDAVRCRYHQAIYLHLDC